MEIKPGIGLGNIRFGFDERLVTELLGRPDHIEEAEILKGSGDWHRELTYAWLAASFRFEQDDDFRLGNITIEGPGHTLMGRDLHGLPKMPVVRFIGVATSEIPQVESMGRTIGHECISYDGTGLMLFFDEGCLNEIQYGYLFESDEETAIWPG